MNSLFVTMANGQSSTHRAQLYPGHCDQAQIDGRLEGWSIFAFLRCLYMVNILLLCAAVVFPTNSVDAQSTSDTDESVYRIFSALSSSNGTTSMSSGTGFLIAEQNFVLTNYHVIEKAKDIKIAFNSTGDRPKTVPAKVVWESADLDIAVLKTNQDLPGSPLALMAQSPPKFPEKETIVSSVGYPGDADIFTQNRGLTSALLTSSRTGGVVSRVVKGSFDRHDQYVIQHDAEISPGNSGGPLVDRCQRVLGINTWGAGDILVATHSSVVIDALRKNNIAVTVEDSPCDPKTVVSSSDYSSYFAGIALLAVAGVFIIWIRQKGRNLAPVHINEVPKQSEDVPTPVKLQNIGNDILARLPLRPVHEVKIQRHIIFKISDNILARISEYSSIWLNDGVLIGRDSNQCDIVVDDDTVSRVHCRIFREKSGLMLEDCNSLTGTTINNAPALGAIHLVNMDNGVVIEIGKSNIQLITED